MPSNAWNIDVIRAREAMARVSQVLGPGNDWGDVLIAHLDTGFTDHEVFNLESATPAIRIADGLNFMDPGVDEPRDPLDYDGAIENPGHGTRTLGLLCGNRQDGFVGVCPGVPVVPYRVTNSVILQGDSIANVARAIMDAVDRNGARVISISLGADSLFEDARLPELGRAVDHAYENGVIVCGAAGQTENSPELVGFTVYPGRYSRSILVGGMNHRRKICFDYDIGRSFVDIWAPADNVPRPDVRQGQPTPFAGVGNGDGTSFATVHVAAAAAMWLRVRGRELDDAGYSGWRRVEAFREALHASFLPLAGNDAPLGRPAPNDRGILDCVRLLDSKLARLEDLRMKSRAENETD
jgi:subtilisin family serine protease